MYNINTYNIDIYIVLFVADKDLRFKKRIEQVLVRKLKMVRGPPFPAHTGTAKIDEEAAKKPGLENNGWEIPKKNHGKIIGKNHGKNTALNGGL